MNQHDPLSAALRLRVLVEHLGGCSDLADNDGGTTVSRRDNDGELWPHWQNKSLRRTQHLLTDLTEQLIEPTKILNASNDTRSGIAEQKFTGVPRSHGYGVVEVK